MGERLRQGVEKMDVEENHMLIFQELKVEEYKDRGNFIFL
jgi:hypothetical protein